jgi:hypothetical protein
MPNTLNPTLAQSAALPCVYKLETKPESELYSLTERMQDQHQYEFPGKESLVLAPCKFFLAKPVTEKPFISYAFRFKRGEAFVDVFVYGAGALVSDRAKRCIESIDDPACHQFYPSALLDKNRIPINDEPYWGWVPLRCVELPNPASFQETQERIVCDFSFPSDRFLPVLENPELFEKVSKIPFWRKTFSDRPVHLSQTSLDSLMKAGLSGIKLQSKRFSNGVLRGDPSVFKIDPMNLRVNFQGSDSEVPRNKEDTKQQAKTAKRIAEIDRKLAEATK